MEAWVVDETSKGALERAMKTIKVPTAGVREALAELRELLPDDPEPDDGKSRNWRMEEVELTVELTGEGSIKMVGGVTLGATGGIKVVFKRSDSA